MLVLNTNLYYDQNKETLNVADPAGQSSSLVMFLQVSLRRKEINHGSHRKRWEKEYRLTESFRVPNASPASMHQLLERMAADRCYLQKYYEFNSVSHDLTECDGDCRVDHVCAAREVDFQRYEQCLVKEGAASINGGLLLVVSVAATIVIAGW
ncbi:hypothetical protein XENOCAPTIV_030329 [Xenoophorus captivus]|uniref:Sphingomyelin phosphodiesterase C-terminal domain-containing protein n=1 Tax=Xenoophorus captivus TaxID=1517983 RepID=A0ABV0R601_9TELE